MIKKLVSLTAIATFCITTLAFGADFYIDPVNGSSSGDGSQVNPWRTFDEVYDANLIETYTSDGTVKNSGAPIKGGDTIYLLDGYHGDFYVTNCYNDQPITITAAAGATPRFNRVYMQNVKNWVVRGLDVSRSNSPTNTGGGVTVSTSSNSNDAARSRYVTIEDCYIYNVEDSSVWTISDWKNASSGVSLHRYSREMTVRNCYIKNVRFGIHSSAPDSLIEGNTIENFSADGIRAVSPGSTYLNNLIMNAYVSMADGDANHDDGIQGYMSYNPGAEIADVTIRGNTIINRTDPNQPFPNTLQGIGCFDGPFINWVIEDNVVCVDHWHAISLYRSWDCVVANNTCLNPYGNMSAWIQFELAAINGLVMNNITKVVDISEASTVAINNFNPSLYDWDDLFVDWENFDFHLAAGSPAIDYGRNHDVTIDYDKDGNPRIMGRGVDPGAYEYASILADAGGDREVEDLLGNGVEPVVLDASDSVAFNGATIVSWSWEQDGLLLGTGEQLTVDLALGTHEIELTVTDDQGTVGVAYVTITVVGSVYAYAGEDVTLYDTDGNGSEAYRLDGSGSAVSEGSILTASWFKEDGSAAAPMIAWNITVPLGEHTYTLKIVASNGDIAYDDLVITVVSGAEPLAGDANEDGVVDLDDFIILKQNYGAAGASWAQGDFNADGTVDLDDFIILKQNYGQSN